MEQKCRGCFERTKNKERKRGEAMGGKRQMMIRLSATLLISFLCFPVFAGGEASCSDIEDLHKVFECYLDETGRLDVETTELAKRMNADNPNGCSECVISAFHSYREAACNFYRNSFDKGSMKSLGNATCRYRLTKQFLGSQDIFYNNN